MKLLLSIIFLSVPLLIFSQQEDEDIEYIESKLWLFEVNLEYDKPVNSFGRNIDSGVLGLSLSVLRERTIDGPLYLGGAFHAFFLGSHTTEYVDNTTLEDISDQASTVGLGFDFVARYYPDFYYGPFEPFAELMLGPRMLYSYTSTTVLNTGESIGFDITDFDMTVAYGFGLGVHTTIYEQYGLNTKVLYHPGFISTYLAKRNDDSINSDNPLDYFRNVSSTSDMFRLQLGFVAIF